MLRLSKLTDYATVILSYIASHQADVYTACSISEATAISLPTVSKVLKLLAKAHVLGSSRGAKGGYYLARNAEAITVAEVISALEGPIALTECSLPQHSCEQAADCHIQANWGLINKTVFEALESITLADMILPMSQKQAEEILIPVTSIRR